MSELYVYTTPKNAIVTLTLDSGAVLMGQPTIHAGRDDAHVIDLDDDLPTQGAILRITAEGYLPFDNRGILKALPPVFELDDVRLALVPAPPEPPPPPNPDADPKAIIAAVDALDEHDLDTKEGCGQFTEDCCTALHEQHSADWGHILKNPGQNQVIGPSGKGHAVDALYLRWETPNTAAGVWDIIHDSESPNATPSFNHKGPTDAQWYYPA
jgi:hypothetical protein